MALWDRFFANLVSLRVLCLPCYQTSPRFHLYSLHPHEEGSTSSCNSCCLGLDQRHPVASSLKQNQPGYKLPQCSPLPVTAYTQLLLQTEQGEELREESLPSRVGPHYIIFKEVINTPLTTLPILGIRDKVLLTPTSHPSRDSSFFGYQIPWRLRPDACICIFACM